MPDRLAGMEIQQQEGHLNVLFSLVDVRVHISAYPGENARTAHGMRRLAIYSGGSMLFELTSQTSEDPHHAGQHKVTFIDGNADPKIAWGICNAVLKHVDTRCTEPKPPKSYLFAQQIFNASARADIAMLKEGRTSR